MGANLDFCIAITARTAIRAIQRPARTIGVGPSAAPFALKVVFHFANLRTTDRSWRHDILRPFKKAMLGRDLPPTLPETPVFGVTSRHDLSEQLTGYRLVLDRMISARNYNDPQARELWASVCEKAKLKVRAWHQHPRDGHAFPEWETEGNTFGDMLYSFLVHALSEVSPASIHRCSACDRFFYEPSQRRVKYCSDRCKKRITMQRYRARQRAQRAPDHAQPTSQSIKTK